MSVQKSNAANTATTTSTIKSSLKRRKVIIQAVLEKSGITNLLCEAVTAAYERGPVDPSKVVPFIIESCLEKSSESKRHQWPQPPRTSSHVIMDGISKLQLLTWFSVVVVHWTRKERGVYIFPHV